MKAAPTTIEAYIEAPAEPLAGLVSLLREKLDAALPETSTELWHGHPVWLDDGIPVAGFKAYPTFVTLLLWRGQAITDASGSLNASGSAEMCEIKFRTPDDLNVNLLDDWLHQISELQAV